MVSKERPSCSLNNSVAKYWKFIILIDTDLSRFNQVLKLDFLSR